MCWFAQTSLYVDWYFSLLLWNLNRLLGRMLASLLWVFIAPPLQLVKLWGRSGIYGQLIDPMKCLLWATLTSAGFPATQTSWKTCFELNQSRLIAKPSRPVQLRSLLNRSYSEKKKKKTPSASGVLILYKTAEQFVPVKLYKGKAILPPVINCYLHKMKKALICSRHFYRDTKYSL